MYYARDTLVKSIVATILVFCLAKSVLSFSADTRSVSQDRRVLSSSAIQLIHRKADAVSATSNGDRSEQRKSEEKRKSDNSSSNNVGGDAGLNNGSTENTPAVPDTTDGAAGHSDGANATEAFRRYSLMLIEMKGVGDWDNTLVFVHGDPAGIMDCSSSDLFSPVGEGTTDSGANSSSGAVGKEDAVVGVSDNVDNTCVNGVFQHGKYNDRIRFQFDYPSFLSAYDIKQPRVEAHDAYSQPQVQNYIHNKDNGEGSFSLLYNCNAPNESITNLTLSIEINGEHTAVLTWTKVCGAGRNGVVRVGHVLPSGSTEFFDDPLVDEEKTSMFRADPGDSLTTLLIQLSPPAFTLDFHVPYLKSSTDAIELHLRKTMTPGTLTADGPTNFSIIYNCLRRESGLITATMAIPPWDNVTISWTKDCGGNYAKGLTIGVDSAYDVLQYGELQTTFNVTDEMTLDDAFERKVHEVPVEHDSIEFRLSNEMNSDIHIQDIATTVSVPDTLLLKVERPRLSMDYYIPKSGIQMKPGDKSKLLLRMFCVKQGTVLVLVTLPILIYKNVEFGFIKYCAEPQVHTHSGFMRTATSLAWIVALFVAALGLVAWRVIRSRTTKNKYSSVPSEGT